MARRTAPDHRPRPHPHPGSAPRRGRLRARLAATLLLGLGTTAGCASGGGNAAGPDVVRIVVENDTRSAVEVRLLIRQQEYRLGRVRVGNTGRYRATPAMLGPAPYRFQVRLLALDRTGTYITPVLDVYSGENVYVDAGPTLSTSRYEIR